MAETHREQEWTEAAHARAGVVGLMRVWVRRIGHRPAAAPLRRMTVGSDRLLYRVTGGRLSTTGVSRIPSLMLVADRPDGTTALIPLQFVRIDGHDYIVGTNWGRPKHPQWTGRLRRNPQCRININGVEHPCHATPVEGPERDAVWPRIVQKSPYYADCQHRAQRELRVFRMDRGN